MDEMRTLDQWLVSRGAINMLDTRLSDGVMQGCLDGPGWFAPQWVDVPNDVMAYMNARRRLRGGIEDEEDCNG